MFSISRKALKSFVFLICVSNFLVVFGSFGDPLAGYRALSEEGSEDGNDDSDLASESGSAELEYYAPDDEGYSSSEEPVHNRVSVRVGGMPGRFGTVSFPNRGSGGRNPGTFLNPTFGSLNGSRQQIISVKRPSATSQASAIAKIDPRYFKDIIDHTNKGVTTTKNKKAKFKDLFKDEEVTFDKFLENRKVVIETIETIVRSQKKKLPNLYAFIFSNPIFYGPFGVKNYFSNSGEINKLLQDYNDYVKQNTKPLEKIKIITLKSFININNALDQYLGFSNKQEFGLKEMTELWRLLFYLYQIKSSDEKSISDKNKFIALNQALERDMLLFNELDSAYKKFLKDKYKTLKPSKSEFTNKIGTDKPTIKEALATFVARKISGKSPNIVPDYIKERIIMSENLDDYKKYLDWFAKNYKEGSEGRITFNKAFSPILDLIGIVAIQEEEVRKFKESPKSSDNPNQAKEFSRKIMERLKNGEHKRSTPLASAIHEALNALVKNAELLSRRIEEYPSIIPEVALIEPTENGQDTFVEIQLIAPKLIKDCTNLVKIVEALRGKDKTREVGKLNNSDMENVLNKIETVAQKFFKTGFVSYASTVQNALRILRDHLRFLKNPGNYDDVIPWQVTQ